MVEDQGKEMPSPSPQQPFLGKVCAILEQSLPILFDAKEGVPPSSGGLEQLLDRRTLPCADERCEEVLRAHKQQTLLSSIAVGSMFLQPSPQRAGHCCAAVLAQVGLATPWLEQIHSGGMHADSCEFS
ncbi:hypothetical protein AV530_015582 [Patagioenas fasciata monilis]|uniref:Uncharacterized protein n=1 Tax=Patagioenas fasciata monilis TaxID=372326 RepID=A0A1V4KI10_PATFA|nr:hypothetical protein AV530_015582 [Patagioenas fasciata monilis]